MKKTSITLAAGLLIGLASGASAQGLLSIGQDASAEDFESGLPFQSTIGVEFGWDSNPNNAPDDFEADSAFVRGGIDAAYIRSSRTTNFSLNAGFSTLYYFDRPDDRLEDTFYSARIAANVHHRVNRRLTIGNNLYFSYEIEPDNYIGASASRRLDQYLYGYNSVWASYAWTRRFSTLTRYTLTGIDYEEDIIAFGEDRLTHTVSQEMRYVLTRLSTLVGDVRWSTTDYDEDLRNYDAVYVLGGVDHSFSADLRGTLRLGAEYRDYDNGGEEWRPYGEGSLRYALDSRTNLVWFNRLGYEDSELGLTTFENRYVFRSALSVNHQMTKRYRTRAGLTYVHREFEDGDSSDIDEDLISLHLGLGYRIYTATDHTLNYNFTALGSDRDLREYDRHRISAGLKYTF